MGGEIYLDTCCYGRPWDDQSDARIAADTLAIMTVIDSIRLAGCRIIGSTAVVFELGNIPLDNPHRADVLDFFRTTNFLSGRIYMSVTAIEIRKAGMKALMDALGEDGTQIFLRQFSGTGNFTKDRREYNPQTHEAIVSGIQGLQKKMARGEVDRVGRPTMVAV